MYKHNNQKHGYEVPDGYHDDVKSRLKVLSRLESEEYYAVPNGYFAETKNRLLVGNNSPKRVFTLRRLSFAASFLLIVGLWMSMELTKEAELDMSAELDLEEASD